MSSVALCGLHGDDVLAADLLNCAAPLRAKLIDSVAPEVNTILASAFTSLAISSRAFSTASSAVQLKLRLREAGLPKVLASNTESSRGHARIDRRGGGVIEIDGLFVHGVGKSDRADCMYRFGGGR